MKSTFFAFLFLIFIFVFKTNCSSQIPKLNSDPKFLEFNSANGFKKLFFGRKIEEISNIIGTGNEITVYEKAEGGTGAVIDVSNKYYKTFNNVVYEHVFLMFTYPEFVLYKITFHNPSVSYENIFTRLEFTLGPPLLRYRVPGETIAYISNWKGTNIDLSLQGRPDKDITLSITNTRLFGETFTRQIMRGKKEIKATQNDY